jgi:hypothetical protein
MGQHKLTRQPVAVPAVVNDEVTFKSCCTEVFRWVRKGIDIAEQTPEFIKSCAETWQGLEDSAKK